MNNFPSIEKKIFIAGSGRCGTTWIGSWLGQHPEIFGGPETHVISLMHCFFNEEWNQGLNKWTDKRVLLDTTRIFILNSLGSSKNRRDKDHVVEYSYNNYKSLDSNIIHIDFIQELFPDAYIIHPYRDGRNVVESWLRTRSDISIELYMEHWLSVMDDMLSHDRKNVLNIKYESLMENPELSRDITKFLGVEHHKDIDSWEFPINTPNFSYDYDRWRVLPEEKQKKMCIMNGMLEQLKYYPRLPRMNKKQVIEQIKKIEHLFKNVEWMIVGSAGQVLLGNRQDAKDIDVVQMSGEPIILNIPYKQNHMSRMYRDLRLDIHYVPSDIKKCNNDAVKSYCVGNAHVIVPAKSYVNKSYHTVYDKWTVATEYNQQLTEWINHFFIWQKNRVTQESIRVSLPSTKDCQIFRDILGEVVFDGIQDRILLCMADKANLYVPTNEEVLLD